MDHHLQLFYNVLLLCQQRLQTRDFRIGFLFAVLIDRRRFCDNCSTIQLSNDL